MEFEWDDAKRLSNLAKHGLDFADVERLDWANAVTIRDLRFADGEERYRAFVRLEGTLHSIALVYRGGVTRILSFRLANRKERKLYG